jgi:hypothetical protein
MLRVAPLFLVVVTVAGCALAGGTLGGRERCWPRDEPLVASVLHGTLRFGVEGPFLETPDGEVISLHINRFDVRTGRGRTALIDAGGGREVATDGDRVSLFGGLSGDGWMYVCGVEERTAA